MEPAPPYRGEGPPALWHVSEDDSIRRFEPRDGKVWAIDTRHLPLYWFPRDCPRATFWACSSTADDDVVRFLGGDRDRRVHVVEPAWLEKMRSAEVVAYRLPEGPFERWDRFWIIELRAEDDLPSLWTRVISSTVDFSGIRLRNATMAS